MSENPKPPRPADLCPQPDLLPSGDARTRPLAPPIYPTSVWICDSPTQADRLLGGEEPGFVYQREGHPNAEAVAEKCRRLHAADSAAITSSGMAALAAVLLCEVQAGDHLVLSQHLYGRTLVLLDQEARRLGLDVTRVDASDLQAVEAAIRPTTRLVVVETIGNPLLGVADIRRLAELAHRQNARLLVDNTFATPVLCRPLDRGADWVVESVSKMMNGHSDVMLGLVCHRGPVEQRERLAGVIGAWGLASSPFDCYLAGRGIATLDLRMQRACQNAARVAQTLAEASKSVASVTYPGLAQHPDHLLAQEQFGGLFGSIVTFHLAGGRAAADRFIESTSDSILFCPSLGEVSTTVSHPQSTSHRGLTEAERQALGIDGGTLRLSLGCESPEYVVGAVQTALDKLD